MQYPFLKTSLFYLCIPIIVIAYGAYLRVINLSDQPYWMDEGYTINAVTSIVEKGNLILDSGLSYNCPIYCYPTSYIVNILGENAFSYRLLASISGIIFLFFLFFIVRKLYNNNIAIISTFLTSFSYYQVAWSREARWYTLFSLLFWIASFSFYFGLKNKNYKLLLLSALSTILAILTHQLGYLLPVIFLIWFTYEHRNGLKKDYFKILQITLPIALIIFLIDYFSGINFFANNISNISFNYVLPYYLLFYMWNYFPFIFLTIYYFFTEDKYMNQSKYILLNLLVYLIPIGTLTSVVHYRYLFHLTPVLFIISSIVIYNLISELKNSKNKLVISLVLITGYFALGYGVWRHQTFYALESDSPKYSFLNRQHFAYTPQPNWNKAYGFIKDNIKSDEVIISSHPHFNKIFLKQAGYWIKYPYLGINSLPEKTYNDREYYVNAITIDDLEELKEITKKNHGYIIFDFMSTDIGRIPVETLQYIDNNFEVVFFDEINQFSKVWAYHF